MDEETTAPREEAPAPFYDFAERLFVISLRSGWEWFVANPWAWDRVLRHVDETEKATVLRLFGEGGKCRTPVIRVGYPVLNAQAPQLTVAIEEEAPWPDGQFLGDVAEFSMAFPEAPTGVAGEILGEFRRQTVTVFLTAEHPDVLLYLYRLADRILIAHRDWFAGQGLQDPAFLAGTPVLPEPRAPDRLWVRQLKWSVGGLVGVPVPIPPPPQSVAIQFEGDTVRGVAGRVTVEQ